MFLLVILYIFLSFKLQRYYMNFNREIIRLKSISASPIIQLFEEAIDGVATIRAFGKYGQILKNYLRKVDDYQKNAIASAGASSWFEVRIAMLTLVVILPMVSFSVRSN